MVEVQDILPELNEEDVWRCLGARGRTVPALEQEVRRGLALGQTLVAPSAIYRRLPLIEIRRGRVCLQHGLVLEGEFLAHCFKGAKEALFLAVTIGSALESRVSSLFAEGDSIAAFVLDAVGSAAVLNAFSFVAHRILEEETRRGWENGVCLQPGQSYWDITGQRTLFQAVPAERIGIRLLESCFMVPQKSQSAVVPLGPDLKVLSDPNSSQCRYCKATRCPLRREAPSLGPG